MTNDVTPAPLDLTAVWSQKLAPIDFVLPGLAIGTIGAMVSAGGVGKTFAMLQTAIGITIGRDVGGLWGTPPKRGPVVFLSLEDPAEIMAIRLHAIKPLLSEAELAEAAGATRRG